MGPRPPKPLADEDAEASIPSGDGATRASEKSASECESRKVVASTENKKESPTVDVKASELEANVRGGGTHGGWRGRRGRHYQQKRRRHDDAFDSAFRRCAGKRFYAGDAHVGVYANEQGVTLIAERLQSPSKTVRRDRSASEPNDSGGQQQEHGNDEETFHGGSHSVRSALIPAPLDGRGPMTKM